MFNRLKRWWRKPQPVVKHVEQVVEIHVLSYEQYKKLEGRLPGTNLTHAENPEQYAFNLGVAHALRSLREGFTVDPSSNSRYNR